MTEYRFWLIYTDLTVHSMPEFARVNGESLQDAVERFAEEHNLSVDSIEGDTVWFVHKDDGTAHKYSIAKNAPIR